MTSDISPYVADAARRAAAGVWITWNVERILDYPFWTVTWRREGGKTKLKFPSRDRARAYYLEAVDEALR